MYHTLLALWNRDLAVNLIGLFLAYRWAILPLITLLALEAPKSL